MLYGTTRSGGAHDDGTVYTVGIALTSGAADLPVGPTGSLSFGTGSEYGPGTDFGASVALGPVTVAGKLSGEFYHSATFPMIGTVVGSDAADKINFDLGPLPQLWTFSFTGGFSGGALT